MHEDQEQEILFDVAVLGEQMDQFLKSDIGKFLSGRIEDEIEDGIADLRRVDCNNAEAVYLAQARVWRAETLRIWLDEAISAGIKARLVLENRDE